jgi:hypothetical protein
MPHLKTGDLILFKAFNNFRSIYTGCYFGHIGIVYVDTDGTPLLFEANGVETVILKPEHNNKGLFLTPLNDRVKKYKGTCFWKQLNKELSKESVIALKEFIDYALDNMKYDMNVVGSALKKRFGIERCSNNTNCGELVFLSLIKANLLPIEEYDKKIWIHLDYVTYLKELNNGYKYLDITEIIDHPFKN